MRRQSAIDHHVGMIGGIAYTLSDYASSILSSQCLYIGKLRDETLYQPALTGAHSRAEYFRPAIP
jgi:hypothetical protein